MRNIEDQEGSSSSTQKKNWPRITMLKHFLDSIAQAVKLHTGAEIGDKLSWDTFVAGVNKTLFVMKHKVPLAMIAMGANLWMLAFAIDYYTDGQCEHLSETYSDLSTFGQNAAGKLMNRDHEWYPEVFVDRISAQDALLNQAILWERPLRKDSTGSNGHLHVPNVTNRDEVLNEVFLEWWD